MGQTITKAADAATLSLEERLAIAEAEIVRKEAENAQLKAEQAASNTVSVKLGPSGGICLYGLQRRPITLYASGWKRLLEPAVKEQVLRVIEVASSKTDANGQPLLATKGAAFTKREDEGENDRANAILKAAL